jgi:hypothetical protein
MDGAGVELGSASKLEHSKPLAVETALDFDFGDGLLLDGLFSPSSASVSPRVFSNGISPATNGLSPSTTASVSPGQDALTEDEGSSEAVEQPVEQLVKRFGAETVEQPVAKRCGANTRKPEPVRPRSPEPVVSSFSKGQTVQVMPRTFPGKNKPGGVGRITKIHPGGECDIKYAMGGRELKVETCYIQEWSTFSADVSRSAAAPVRFVAKPASGREAGNPEDNLAYKSPQKNLGKKNRTVALVSGSKYQPAAMGEYIKQPVRHSFVGEYFKLSGTETVLYFHPQRKRW